MAFESIKAGLKVITRGGVAGAIASVIRHPVSRNVLAVIIAPVDGTGDPMDNIVAGTRHLRAA